MEFQKYDVKEKKKEKKERKNEHQEPLPWEITARRLRPPPHAPPMGTALGDDTGQGWKASVSS